jgi:betaine-aldehyde dehydrogenase
MIKQIDMSLNNKKLYIGGRWIDSESKVTIDVFNPATGKKIAEIANGSKADVLKAVQSARQAFGPWSEKDPILRAQFLRKIADGLQSRSDEIVDLISLDVGMPRKMAKIMQLGLPINILNYYADLVEKYSFEELHGDARVLSKPLGVAACITPWNYPLFQIAAKVGPALGSGCTVVLKPSEVAPLATFVFAEIIDSINLPAGVFNLITGTGEEFGEVLVTSADVDIVSFTGSTQVGKRINQLSAPTLKKVTLELGGKSASVVLKDADYEKAVKATVSSCFLNSGQTCLAQTRLIIPEEDYEICANLAVSAVKNFTVGDPFDDSSKLGPLVSKIQQSRVRSLIDSAIHEGAELLIGGSHLPINLDGAGYYVLPTILGRVNPNSEIAQQEVFGPVLSILTYKTEQEALDIANNSQYGLSGAVWSRDIQKAQKFAEKIETGQIHINGGKFILDAPFGGWKNSGRGHELGLHGMQEYMSYRTLLG